MIKIKNAKALYLEKDKIWIARGLKFWAINYSGEKVSKTFSLGSSIYCIRPLRHLLRKGIHGLFHLSNGNFLVSLKKKTLLLDSEGNIISKFEGYIGNKPAHKGITVIPNGYIFFGEYSLNNERKMEIKLYRNVDNGLSFQVVKTFPVGDIRHIHFVEWDNFDKCLWLGTGDYGKNNEECRLYRSFDYGESFELVGHGSQMWRSISVCPQKENLIWATDAGSCKDKNYLVSLDKTTKKLSLLKELSGPCHCMCKTKAGKIYISTGVEGGENELDKFAKLYKYDNNELIEIIRVKKDCLPYIVQYGVIRFPSGSENTNRVVYTMMGLKRNGETVYINEDL